MLGAWRLAFLGLNLAMFLPVSAFVLAIPFVPTAYRPKPTPSTQRNNQRALDKGWPLLAVQLMTAYQHLTVCTMQLTTAYLLLSGCQLISSQTLSGPLVHRLACDIRLILPGAGAIVAHFWTFVLILGPYSIADRTDFPADEAKARVLIRRLFYVPTLTPSCAFLALMHVQHTWMPALPWVEAMVFDTGCPAAPLPRQLLLTLSYLLGWLALGMLTWRARGTPPYPILRTIWLNRKWPYLYLAMALQAYVALHLSKALLDF